MSLQIQVAPDAMAVSTFVGQRMAAAIVRTLAQQHVAHICITGGRGGHAALTALASLSGIDWHRVHVWWSDERYVELGSDLRNDTMARSALLDAVDLPVDNVHHMPSSGQFQDIEDAAAAYATELAAFGRPGPDFCVSILGMGEDGHVASLFPEHPGLREQRGVFPVVDSPKPPPRRLSMSFEVINQAREVILIATGSGKADAVGLLMNDPGPFALPAAGVHGTVLTLLALDDAAAVHVPGELRV